MSPVDEQFEVFAVRHYDELFRYACVLTGNSGDAGDLVHDTLLKLRRHMGRADIEHEHAYARRALFTVFLSGRRRRLRDVLGAAPDWSTTTRDPAEGIVLRDEILGLLTQLPPRVRAAVTARYLLDMTEQATAELLGCSVGTVKSSTSRGLARLRELSTSSSTTNPTMFSNPR